MLCTQRWMSNSAFLSNPCISACDPVSCWQRIPLVMWDTVSWMRMALCSPRRDLEGYSIKACEGFKCHGKEVGWGEAPAAVPEETSLPSSWGIAVLTQSEISGCINQTIPWCITQVHLPGSVSGLCKWAGTAGSLKTGAWEEPVSATPHFSHFNIVTSLKPNGCD